MPEYLSPAVYVEELSSGVKPITGASTSTAGFVGHTVKGPIGVAVPINNFAEFQGTFGGFFGNGVLAFAVKSFFDEGGSTCYVVRTCHYAIPTGGSTEKPTAIAANRTYNTVGSNTQQSLLVEAASPGEWGNELSVHINADLIGFDGLAASTALKKGDVLLIDGHAQNYVLTADIAANNTGALTGATISPGLEQATPDNIALSVVPMRSGARGATNKPTHAQGATSIDFDGIAASTALK